MPNKRVILFADGVDDDFVDRLVKALGEHGISLVHDRGAPGGPGWKEQVAAAVRSYDHLLVAWSRKCQVDELWAPFAADAVARLKLVIVLTDAALPAGPLQTLPQVDLSRWRSSPANPGVLRLAALLGGDAPSETGIVGRILRCLRLRLALVGGTFAICVPCAAFALNVFGAQESVCAMVGLQPRLSDWCGELGLGGRPTKAERLDWARLDRRSAPALAEFINRHPDGVYHGAAADLLQACKRVTKEDWVSQQSALPLLVPRLSARSPSESGARALAARLADSEAESACRALGLNDGFRYRGPANARIDSLSCMPVGDSSGCEAQGVILCTMERVAPREVLVCGSATPARGRS